MLLTEGMRKYGGKLLKKITFLFNRDLFVNKSPSSDNMKYTSLITLHEIQ